MHCLSVLWLYPFSVVLGPIVIEEIKKIIRDSEITKEDDNNWPAPDRVGRQELEIKLDKEHISFTVSREILIPYSSMLH